MEASVGVVWGSFAPLHSGHIDLIANAKRNCDEALVVVCGYAGDKGYPKMTVEQRFQAVRAFYADDDLVTVIKFDEDELEIPRYPDGWDAWLDAFESYFAKRYPMHFTRLFYVGDSEYYNGLRERKIPAVLVHRPDTAMSATKIRNAPFDNWDHIAPTFRKFFTRKILIAGPASEGKTNLVRDLGKYYGTAYGHEYAREYLAEHGLREEEMDTKDYLIILARQYELHESLINSPQNRGIFFADSDAIVTKMWANHYMDKPDFVISRDDYPIINGLANYYFSLENWDIIILFYPSNGFTDDGVRYMPDADIEIREKMYNWLYEEYKKRYPIGRIVIMPPNESGHRDYDADYFGMKAIMRYAYGK